MGGKLRLFVLICAIAFYTLLYSGHLDSFFQLGKYSGEYPLISTATLERTSGWISVEGVVYNLGNVNLKKHVNLSEVDSKLLTKDKVVGFLCVTFSELSKMNGKNAPVMVSVNGIVYNLSNSRSWANGMHKNQHVAGQDLTYDILKLSPHGVSRIRSFPSYGVLVFSPDELIKFDGKSTKKIYLSVYGVVYDATYSKKFAGGEHYGHPMGVDLTKEILSLEGHVQLLNKLFPIGLLVFDEKNVSKFDGKDNKPFVSVGDKVYDISRNSQGVQPGKVFVGEVRKEWLLVGYRFK
ncbi:MAG: cytochrome B5 [Fervidobacterium sp.]|nr:cytochrome B5 [Fervidobacterium sp.]